MTIVKQPFVGRVAAGDDYSDIIVSIIIAAYNCRELLADCLESVFENPPSAAYEVIVVDDASTDRTDAMVRKRFPQVHLLCNKRNVHYGKSVNRALNIARGRYIHFLNSDTIMLPDVLDEMAAYLENHPEAGAVGSKLLNSDGSIQWSVKTLPNPFSALFGARSIITRMFPENRLSRRHLLHLDNDNNEPLVAGYVSSASVMIPRKVIDHVSYLDERLSYHIDADYCKRISAAGWQIHYLPSVCVIHLDHKGGTMVNRTRRFKSVIEFHLGSYIYFRKHLMTSPWTAMHMLAIIGLGCRFLLSFVVQAYKELMMEVRRRLGSSKSKSMPPGDSIRAE